MLGFVGNHVKIHKITATVGNERGDIEMKDYVVFPHGQDNCLFSHLDCQLSVFTPDPKNEESAEFRFLRNLMSFVF